MAFRDRTEAGLLLAERLCKLDLEAPVVVGMARGGVPVALEIATALGAPLDVIVVRKLGHPSQPELGLGALAEGGVRVVNEKLVAQLQVSEELIERVVSGEGLELKRRVAVYRGDRSAVEVSGRTAVVVDDGLATGFTALAAVEAMRRRGAQRVVLAVPVAPPSAVATLEVVADDVVCLEVTERFFGLSEWYADFRQITDDEVVDMLVSARTSRQSHSAEARPSEARPSEARPFEEAKAHLMDVEVPACGELLAGELVVPPDAFGLVLFAHGSGSSRLSPRNLEVAATLQRAGLATLLFDLLTEQEAYSRANVFDIGLLSERMEAAVMWVRKGHDPDRWPLPLEVPIGFFGASTGAGAALVAAAHLGADVAAVVSHGGRPDLAGADLSGVLAPTLLIVGGADEAVLELNQKARMQLGGENRLEVIPYATHLFEEPGALDQVAQLAAHWFTAHLFVSPPS